MGSTVAWERGNCSDPALGVSVHECVNIRMGAYNCGYVHVCKCVRVGTKVYSCVYE